ncbi:MAG: nucleoside triphosphate pyrophosphohydrolase [Alphaproteobacteria bacterium]|nr:nucleoside triphosphate pyrophosphohydrolase [Alphaproteobacteria bacterium]
MADSMDTLLKIMAQLRDKDNGCPWDVEQDFASIAPCTIEEAYEVVDAIYENDMDHLREELGDLLLQVVFHAQMASEEGLFNFDDIANGISQKLIRRHPHVFGDAKIKTAAAQTESWEAIKAQERAHKQTKAQSLLDDVPKALPALTRAYKLQKRAAKVGFDWDTTAPILAKLEEESRELQAEIDAGASKDKLTDELGDILFVCVNLARQVKVDPEEALMSTNRKFERRFRYIEHELALQGRTAEDATLKEMDILWDAAKSKEKEKTHG